MKSKEDLLNCLIKACDLLEEVKETIENEKTNNANVKVGDYVRVIGNTAGFKHHIPIGQIVEVTAISKKSTSCSFISVDGFVFRKNKYSFCTQAVSINDIEILNKEECI